MPRIRYPAVITESREELAALERALRGQPLHARVQLLRLLQTGQARALGVAAQLVGYGERTGHRWWAAYRDGGLARLLEQRPRPGKRSQLTEEAWAGLDAAMRRGEIGTLQDARRYLREQWHIAYQSLHGVWAQLVKRKARLKTGRRHHRQADPVKQDEYKRSLRRHPQAGAV
jgi:transposase